MRFHTSILNLDPYGDILRTDQHHTIHELGFVYTGELLKDAHDRYKAKIDEFMKNEGIIKWDGRDVYKIVLDNKEYKLLDYTVLAGRRPDKNCPEEKSWRIQPTGIKRAEKFCCCESRAGD
jgi:hypothetical protein